MKKYLEKSLKKYGRNLLRNCLAKSLKEPLVNFQENHWEIYSEISKSITQNPEEILAWTHVESIGKISWWTSENIAGVIIEGIMEAFFVKLWNSCSWCLIDLKNFWIKNWIESFENILKKYLEEFLKGFYEEFLEQSLENSLKVPKTLLEKE